MKKDLKQTIFENKTQNERLELLKANAVTIEREMVKVHFSEDDLAEMKSRLSENSIIKNDLEIEKKDLTTDLNLKIKEQKGYIKGLLGYLKLKYEEQSQEVFLFDDQENGLMLTYNCVGELIATRRLRPAEKQTRIVDFNQKTG